LWHILEDVQLVAVDFGAACGIFWHNLAHFKSNNFKLYFEVIKIVTNIIKLN